MMSFSFDEGSRIQYMRTCLLVHRIRLLFAKLLHQKKQPEPEYAAILSIVSLGIMKLRSKRQKPKQCHDFHSAKAKTIFTRLPALSVLEARRILRAPRRGSKKKSRLAQWE